MSRSNGPSANTARVPVAHSAHRRPSGRPAPGTTQGSSAGKPTLSPRSASHLSGRLHVCVKHVGSCALSVQPGKSGAHVIDGCGEGSGVAALAATSGHAAACHMATTCGGFEGYSLQDVVATHRWPAAPRVRKSQDVLARFAHRYRPSPSAVDVRWTGAAWSVGAGWSGSRRADRACRFCRD